MSKHLDETFTLRQILVQVSQLLFAMVVCFATLAIGKPSVANAADTLYQISQQVNISGDIRGMTDDGNHVWVTSSNSHVYEIDIATRSVINDLFMGTGADPRDITHDEAYVWVVNLGGQTPHFLAKISIATGKVVDSFSLDSVWRFNGPIASDGNSVWLGVNWGSEIAQVNCSDGTLIRKIDIGGGVGALAYDGTNVWATNYGLGQLIKIDPLSGTIVQTIATAPTPSYFVSNGRSVWLPTSSNSTLTEYSASTGQVLRSTYIEGHLLHNIAFDGQHLYVGGWGQWAVIQLDSKTLQYERTIGVGMFGNFLSVDPKHLWVADGNWDQKYVSLVPIPGTISVSGFAINKSRANSEVSSQVLSLAKYLNQHHLLNVRLIGYMNPNSDGSFLEQLQLSRVETVRRLLVKDFKKLSPKSTLTINVESATSTYVSGISKFNRSVLCVF